MLKDKMQVSMRKGIMALLVAMLVLLAVALLPLAVVWSIGTLSGAPVHYTFFTWLAGAVLIGVVVLAAQL